MPHNEPRHAISPHDAPPFPIDLHAMIDALRHLYHHVFHAGLRHRLQSHHQHNRDVEFPSISEALDTYARHRSDATPTIEPPAPTPAAPRVSARRVPFNVDVSWLASRFRASKQLNIHNHALADKLRASANCHLSHAVCLSRRAQDDHARIHVRLAEAAVQEARRYLPRDDFLALKREFENKLALLKSAPSELPRQDPPAPSNAAG